MSDSTTRMLRIEIPALLFVAFCALTGGAAAQTTTDARHIYGIHSWGNGANGLLNGKTGWTVEVVNTDYWPYDLTVTQAQQLRAEGWTLVIRINKFFGKTVPVNSGEFNAFAVACADKVTSFSAYCHTWIIGNEMNASFESLEGPISVATYAEVYRRARTAIHNVQPEATVLVAPLAPWNASTTGAGPYPSNRQWLNYFYALVRDIGSDADGFAIHAYGGRSGDSDPRNDDELSFGVYKRWMEIIDGYAPTANKPVYLTEMNSFARGQSSTPGFPLDPYPAGYIQKLFEEIGIWNQTHSHRIRCACWFAYANGGFPGYNISTSSPMADDFRDATANTNWIGADPTAVSPASWNLLE
ncbi:MAG: hypothetical protein V2A74_05545 [bacterium]